MPVYALFQKLTVTDAAGLTEYLTKVKPLIESMGGTYLVRGGDWETLEGTHRPPPVLFKFADLNAALHWYNSKEYRPLRDLRHRSATYDAALLTGIEPSGPHA